MGEKGVVESRASWITVGDLLLAFYSLIAECKILICPITKRLLKIMVGLEGLIFATDQITWQAIPCVWKDDLDFVILFQRVIVVSAGKVCDLGIGCGEGRGSSYFGRLQIISRKQPGGNVLFLEPCSMLLEQRETCRVFGSTNGHAGHGVCALLRWFPQTTRFLCCLPATISAVLHSCMWKALPRWWGWEYTSAIEKAGREERWSVLADTHHVRNTFETC